MSERPASPLAGVAPASDHRGLLIDVGGVLTTDIFASFDAFCAREGLAVASFRELYFDEPEVREFIPEMTDVVEALRRSGVRTGVLSNSWWFPMYERPFYARAFDVQVISGKVGLRKPQREMFEHGLAALGVAPERVLFVDDFEENLPPAQELGMAVFLHDPDRPGRTVAELERRFGLTESPRR
jgi:HAD superfamily hydrolase (TIGR01509 family)